MSNGDMPAMPVRDSVAYNLVHGEDCYAELSAGLTKREELAARAMIGLIANKNGTGGQFERCAEDAVAHADALLAELEKDQ